MKHNYSVEISDTAGKIFDIFNSCRWLYYGDELLEMYNKNEIEPDDEIKSSINYIIKNVPLPSYKMELLFLDNDDTNLDFITYYFSKNLWVYSSVERFLEYVKSLNKIHFINSIINYFDKSTIKQKLSDCSVATITECLEKTLIKDEIKYKILVICAEPETLIFSIHQLFSAVAEKINVIYNKFNKRMIDFRLAMEKPIISLSDEVFKILTSNYLQIKSDDNSIKIALSFLNDYAIIPIQRKIDCVYAVLGIGYKKALKLQLEKEKLTNINFLNVTKALADQIRIDMVDMLTTGGKYTSEIADNLHLPFPKAFYHLSILAKSNILTYHNEGKRVYYEINSDFFLYLSQYINRKYVTDIAEINNIKQKEIVNSDISDI